MFDKENMSNIWNRFLQALKDRDYSAITRKLISAGLLFLGLLCVIPTVLILWVLKPVFWLKVGRLSNTRIGHLAFNTDQFLRRRQLGIYADGPFYCFICDSTKLANRQLLIMWKRLLPICESRALNLVFLGMRPILKRTPFFQDMQHNSTEYYEFQNADPSLYFIPDEIEKGRKLLNQMDIDLDKDEFICIVARDNAYLKHTFPHNNWDYHNERNGDIDSLIETAKYLIEKGFIVIRLGSIVEKPINFSHKKMIDYPYSEYRSDFLDIFLQAHCKFIIQAGTSGIADVATIFDKPMLAVDTSQFGVIPITKNCLYTPKKFKYSNTGNYLKFKDALKLEPYWYHPTDFGLESEEISPQDILEAAKELLARVEGRFKYSPESERLIQAYHKLWSESGLPTSHVKIPIGIAWLKKNQALYF
jgi:putative glycosyltransferase (TIGR04372 family)